MQTLERSTDQPSGPPNRPRGGAFGLAPAIVLSILALPVLLWLVTSKWGVLIAALVAITAGIGIWVWRRGFVFIELVAFLVHFDGLGAGPIRMGRLVAGVGGIYLLYKLAIERWRPPAIPTRHWVPVWLLTAVGLVSGAWSGQISAWLFAMGLLGLALVFFGITALLVDSHEKVQQYLRAYWWGGLWGSGAGIIALFLGTRSVGFGADPNFFGLLQASMIPLTVYYRRMARTTREKHLYTFLLMFVLAGAAGAGSRSGLIGGAVAIFGTMVTRPGINTKQRIRVGVGAIFIAAIAFLIGFVANPNNLARGFADRGAGRLDFWNVTLDLIAERPVLGWGFGQVRTQILPNLLVTPGVENLDDGGDPRADVSSHHTWMDVQGDLGVMGTALFAAVFIVALWGFARPRWRHTKQLSTTMFVMMLPVLTGSNFLPLLN
ncbi:MAG: O-antigen ligase family protein, partial [Actinomycetes bacterium]